MSKTIMSVYSLGDNNLRSSKYGISSSSTQYSGGETTRGIFCFSLCKSQCASQCASNCGSQCASQCTSQCASSCMGFCSGGADDLANLYENIELIKL